MNQKKRESQSTFILQKRHFLYCLDKQIVSVFAPHVRKKVLCFLSFWHERSSAVNMQDKEWLTQLLTRQLTMLWSQCADHLLMASLLASDGKLYMEQKKHVLYSTNLYAYFTIYFYYHFNKYKTTLWFKRKQWVLKRH